MNIAQRKQHLQRRLHRIERINAARETSNPWAMGIGGCLLVVGLAAAFFGWWITYGAALLIGAQVFILPAPNRRPYINVSDIQIRLDELQKLEPS